MCELKVILNGKMIFGRCIHAKEEDGNVTLKDILGNTQTIEDCTMGQVDIGRETLTLKNLKRR